jgi:hypothetical protein
MDGMMRPKFTLPELEKQLQTLKDGGTINISRYDYERLFGVNDAAIGRLRNFARSHHCVASFADTAVLLRKRLTATDEDSAPQP